MKLLGFWISSLSLLMASSSHAAPFRPSSSQVHIPRSGLSGWSGRSLRHDLEPETALPETAATARDAALSIPRGGGVFGTPITKDQLVASWILFSVATGALMPAPEKVTKLYQWPPHLVSSLELFCFESLASSFLGLATMIYLSVFTKADPTKTVVMGTLASGYVAYKSFLNNSYTKLGMAEGIGLCNMITFGAMYLSYFSGVGDAGLVAKIIFALPTLYGIIGSLAPEVAAKIYGLDGLGSVQTKCSFLWMSRMMAIWGFMLYSLSAFEQDALTTVGRATLLHTLVCLDATFITKDTANVGAPAAAMLCVTALSAVVSLGLLMG